MDLSTLQQLHFVMNSPPLFTPGAKAQYADPGYFLLGMIIEQVTSRPYREVLRERMHSPLGMESTRVLDQWQIVKNRVSPNMARRGRLLRARRDWQVELPSQFGILSSLKAKWPIGAPTRSEQPLMPRGPTEDA